MTAINRFERELKSLLDLKANTPIRYSGLMGIYVDGVEVVAVPNRPNFVYIRLNNSETEIIQAFNNSVNGIFDLAVVVEKSPNLNYYRVVDIQIEKYQTMNNVTFAPKHAQTHLFGGTDPIYIYKHQLLQPFGTVPTPSPSMRVQIFGDYYLWNGQIVKLEDIQTIDLSVYLPTGGSNGRFVTIYVDGNTNSLGYLAGDEFLNIFFSTGTDYYIPEVSQNLGIQVSSILLFTGTTTLIWDNIKDIRHFLNNNTASSAIALHALDPAQGYHSGTLPGSYVTITDAGNYYTGTTTEQIFQEIGSEIADLISNSGGNAQLHGLYRGSIISGTSLIGLPDFVEYIDNVFINNILLDPLLYGLTTGNNSILFNSPVPYNATVVSNYVILQG